MSMDTIVFFYKKRGAGRPWAEPVGLKTYMLIRVPMDMGEEWPGRKGWGGTAEDSRPGDVWSGCYERYASVTALVRKTKKIDAGLDSGRRIFEAFGQEAVRKAVDEWIDEIVYGLVTLVYVFNPSHILLGIMAQPYIMEEIPKRLVLHVTPIMRDVCIRGASLGNTAGLAGISALACGRLGNPGQPGDLCVSRSGAKDRA